MQKGGHDGALAEPEPEPPAEPEPKAENEFNPGSESYPTLTPTSTYPHPHLYPLPQVMAIVKEGGTPPGIRQISTTISASAPTKSLGPSPTKPWAK